MIEEVSLYNANDVKSLESNPTHTMEVLDIYSKIKISQTEYHNIVEISNINDIDFLLFTNDFFIKMNIHFTDIQIKYEYLYSQKELVLRGDDELKSQQENINYKYKLFPFITSKQDLSENVFGVISYL